MIRCFTLFDLGSEQSPNKNWISLLQSISLYDNFEVVNLPRKIYRDIKGLDFGESYNDFQNVWLFDFSAKNANVDDLCKIIQHLPIICGLNETVKIPLKCALIDTENKNICFLSLKDHNK
jgi:hypothetical protein